jgi:hypothetical protein
MVDLASGILQARLQVLRFQIRQLLENFLTRQRCGKEIENVGDANAHSTNAWAPAALFRVDGDSGGQIHHALSVARKAVQIV